MSPESRLNQHFLGQAHYLKCAGESYSLLPFRFTKLDSSRYVITNIAGEYLVLPRSVLHQFVRFQLPMHSPVYNSLKSKHFLFDDDSNIALELLATKLRTKNEFLSQFTALHMFVVTLRCDHSCPYCQVSRQSEDKLAYDMSEETADAAIDFMFKSPSSSLKVEYQGGETLMNFDLIRYITLKVKERNVREGKNVQFVVATNLSPLSDEHLHFFAEHDVYISTSLDGPKELHNLNRPRPGGDSFDRTLDGIDKVQEHLGPDKISALMTTTEASLDRPEEIIDEYISRGFSSIFLRPISPYGFAVRTRVADRYNTEQWLEFYKKALDYVISVNQQGTYFREEYATLILRKMLTPWPTGYVDLQSPAGIGISAIVFNYDGSVYASDESRMLSEMGDDTFKLGELGVNKYEEIMLSDALLTPLLESVAEIDPCCSDCAFLPFCGSDPVFHYRSQGDFLGSKPNSGFCAKNMEILRHLISLLEDVPAKAEVLKGWLQ